MERNGMHVLDFQAPALVRKQLTYLRATQFADQLVALYFLPYAVIVVVETLDHQAERFQWIDATLLVVSSSDHPFHRMWIEQSDNRGLRCWPTLLDNCIGPSAWPLRNPRCTATPSSSIRKASSGCV
jgi:alkyl hydroperoxide reductase subunit AhpC